LADARSVANRCRRKYLYLVDIRPDATTTSEACPCPDEVRIGIRSCFIGYVSDEIYSALLDVVVEFERDGEPVLSCTSSPRGAIYGDCRRVRTA
jgi:hypothetical protein